MNSVMSLRVLHFKAISQLYRRCRQFLNLITTFNLIFNGLSTIFLLLHACLVSPNARN